jgi:hypothetical protein
MLRKIPPVLLAIALAVGCASSSKLSKKSEEKLASGDAWRAWELATRALDKEPGNPRAREAATAAGAAIVQDWQRRIHALAEVDSLHGAEEVLKLAEFRLHAARYATIPVGPEWPAEERTLRRAAARVHYQRGVDAANAGRPKKAYTEFSDALRFDSAYRDAAKRADRAQAEALTRVAVVPFRAPSSDATFGANVAQAWQDDLTQSLGQEEAPFTRILGADAIKRSMTVADLEGLTREEAIRFGRKMGAERVVWGSVGPVRSTTRLDLFRDSVARRVVVHDEEGHERVTWIEVPIEVVARVRDVTAGVDYEVIETAGGSSLVHRHLDRSTSARVVWTSYQPEGDLGSYVLVSETVRAAHPDRAREVETRWKAVCGDAVTLTQVLEARRKAGPYSSGHYAREALPRFAAGAAFVFLEDLPPAEDLALTALSRSAAPLRDDLLRLDSLDDADLGVSLPDASSR